MISILNANDEDKILYVANFIDHPEKQYCSFDKQQLNKNCEDLQYGSRMGAYTITPTVVNLKEVFTGIESKLTPIEIYMLNQKVNGLIKTTR